MSPTPDEIKLRLELAVAAAREAGEISLRYFQRDDLEVELKQDASPVTIADRQAEEHLRNRILETFPTDGVLGEEYPETTGESGFRWILDPIDGTKSFVSGVPLYGNLVAVEWERKALVGVINIPGLDEFVYAATGLGAWHVRGGGAPRPARVSKKAQLCEGLFCLCEVVNFNKTGRKEAYERLQSATRLTRTWGDCYGYLLVATGRAEVMIDPVVNVWDAAAIQPILEEAGGTFTDWQGRPSIHSREGIATNGLVLEEVLAITRDYPPAL